MAKKRSSKQNSQTPKEFSSSPFKDLKGLPAFSEQSTPPRQEIKPLEEIKDTLKPSAEQHSFADEMTFLGVAPLPGRDIEECAPVKDSPAPSSPPSPSRQENDLSAFLDAVGSMEKTFKESWPDDEPARQAVPRRMRQVARGQLKPEAELDLHGLTVGEASAKLGFFLRDAVYQGFKTVLIITGKGLHSIDGPVLRLAMEKLLQQKSEEVIEWGIAPRRYGGEGALLVFLRQSV